jgi:hypothetical protein
MAGGDNAIREYGTECRLWDFANDVEIRKSVWERIATTTTMTYFASSLMKLK